MNTQIEEFDMNENLEIFQIIEEWKLDFHLGNAVKHILSSGKKETEDEELQDLKSASWYLTRKIQVLNNETCNWENVKDLDNDFISFDQNWNNGDHRLSGNIIKLSYVDSHNFIVHISVIGNKRFVLHRRDADGVFAEKCYNKAKNKHYINKVLSVYNSLQP